jgi:hypothetical protein
MSKWIDTGLEANSSRTLGIKQTEEAGLKETMWFLGRCRKVQSRLECSREW